VVLEFKESISGKLGRVDRAKLRAAIKESERVRAEIAAGRRGQYDELKALAYPRAPAHQSAEETATYWRARDAYRAELERLKDLWGAARATRLYSLMAATRGRLHVRWEWVPDRGPEGRLKKVERTWADQDGLIARDVDDFLDASKPQVDFTLAEESLAPLRAAG
jgi:hypothetical protein